MENMNWFEGFKEGFKEGVEDAVKRLLELKPEHRQQALEDILAGLTSKPHSPQQPLPPQQQPPLE
jgi:hypothetical protein